MLDPYHYNEFENLIGQIRKMDYSRSDLKKYVFKEKKKVNIFSHIKSSFSQIHNEKK